MTAVGIGERLREARMRQKVDVADVEAATKIRAKYLRALENEEFGLLPGNTFVKTFLRTYAEYLGLDPQLLLEEYRASYEPRAEGEMQQYSVAARQRRPERRRPPRAAPGPPGPGTALIVLVGVVLVIFAILGLTSDSEPEESASTQREGRERPRTDEPRERQRERPAVRSVRLRVTPDAATYLCVDRGPGTETIYEDTASDPVTFRGKRVRINAGTTSVRLEANGKRVRVPPGPDAIGYDFRARGGKLETDTIELGERPCA
jgi:cytoskeletal protein RodZ